jgi:hypothetical protein
VLLTLDMARQFFLALSDPAGRLVATAARCERSHQRLIIFVDGANAGHASERWNASQTRRTANGATRIKKPAAIAKIQDNSVYVDKSRPDRFVWLFFFIQGL